MSLYSAGRHSAVLPVKILIVLTGLNKEVGVRWGGLDIFGIKTFYAQFIHGIFYQGKTKLLKVTSKKRVLF